VFLKAEAEMLRGRISLILPAELVDSLNTSARFKTSSYRRKASLLCTYVSYRISHKVFNEMTGRDRFGCPISLQTFVRDFIEEGQAIRRGKQELAQQILLQNGFDLNIRYIKDKQVPREWVNNGDMMITITGNDPLSSLIDGWDEKNPCFEPLDEIIDPDDQETEGSAEEEYARKLYSEPDMKKFHPVKKRRRSRVQVSEDEIEEISNGYVKWYNNLGQERVLKIIHTWSIEKSSDDIVYIMIDAVYVTEQSEKHIKGGKPEAKKNKDRIHHWNVAVEVDGTRYALTAIERTEVYQQLFAFLLKNDLMGRFFIFMIDGEKAIFDDINLYFGSWKEYIILLDWYHIEEKVIQKMSSAIIHKMVKDPRSEDGKKNTALSNLYSRKLLSILWVGNVNEGISYCRNIDPALIKNQNAMDELITYFTNKGKYMTCYALRRRAGLRNSSNGSENVNDVTVARRQKDDNQAWREAGSSSASNISCLFYNGEDELWFSKYELTFDIQNKRHKDGQNIK
jgi:hypothetical protein